MVLLQQHTFDILHSVVSVEVVETFKDEVQAALFKDPVRTAQ